MPTTPHEVVKAIYLHIVEGLEYTEIETFLGHNRNWASQQLRRTKGTKWDSRLIFDVHDWCAMSDLLTSKMEWARHYKHHGTLTAVYSVTSRWTGVDPKTISQSDWDRRIGHFGDVTAPLLAGLLAECRNVAVTWGETTNAPVAAMCATPGTALAGPQIEVWAANGEMAHIEDRRCDTSSSLIAEALAYALNGKAVGAHPMTPVVDFISMGTPDAEAEIVRRHYERFPQHQAFFGTNGILNGLDAVVTSCGDFDQKRHFVNDLRKCEVNMEEVQSTLLGDIGGAWIANEMHSHGQILARLRKRWMGMTIDQYRRVARRIKDGHVRSSPGVILMALGANKKRVVEACLQQNLVNVLIADEDLLTALGGLPIST